MTTRPPLVRHAVALAIVLLTYGLKVPIERMVGPGPPLIFFVPAVTISAWQGGAGPGLLATALSAVLCMVVFFPPVGSLRVSSPNDLARLAAFLLEGVVTSVLMESLQVARLRAEQSRRETEAFRKESQLADEKFRMIIDNTDAFIYLKNLDLEYVAMNRKLREIAGISPGEFAGLTDLEMFPADVAGAIRANDRIVLANGKGAGCEEVIPLGDGPHTYVSQRFPLFDTAGEIYAVGGVSTDITPLKEAQRRALQAERLAAIGQMIAGLAHEGRNALQRSQACLEMLARQVEDRPGALDLVAGIQEAQDDLHRLYEEVRCYAAPIILQRRSCRIGDLLREAWSRLATNRSERDALLRERGRPDLACSVDAFRLIQVFRNILDNSLAAAHDPVEIDVEWSVAELAGRPAVKIVIRDNGPGLTPEQRRNLFEPFYTTKSQGTGLGMAIAKRVIDAHDGAIEAASEGGAGTSILITLPRDEP